MLPLVSDSCAQMPELLYELQRQATPHALIPACQDGIAYRSSCWACQIASSIHTHSLARGRLALSNLHAPCGLTEFYGSLATHVFAMHMRHEQCARAAYRSFSSQVLII